MVGFYFHSDVPVVSVGACVDDLKIVGRRTAVFDELSINGTFQTLHRQEDHGVMTWNTSEGDEELYGVEALAHCGDMPLADRTTVIVERTAPEGQVVSRRLQSGNNITVCIDTGIGGGSPIMSVRIADSGLSALFDSTTQSLNATWSRWLLHNSSAIPDGVYSADVIVTDAAGNTITVPFTLEVDNTAPVVSFPTHVEFDDGSVGNVLRWNVSDAHPATYWLLVDGSVVSEGTWTNGLEFVMDDLTVGDHNVTAVFLDEVGLRSVVTALVTVRDVTPPDLSHPEDITYVGGTVGHSISCTATEEYPAFHEMFGNGMIIASGSWSGSVITINVDDLAPSAHNFTVRVADQYGNEATDTVFVTVTTAGTATSATETTSARGDVEIPLGGQSILIVAVAAGVILVVVVLAVLRRRG
ncbi:MAG: Ig-like domain-containing protein [Candidatus Thorarchaeota archaeon]